jgi:hypothetical protein
VFGSSVVGGATISWPGVGRRVTSDDQPELLNRLNDPVQRLYNVVVNHTTLATQEAALDPATLQPIRIVYVDQHAAAGGDGSVDHPFTRLAQAQTGSQPGDIIFVKSGTYTDSIALKNDQRLLGDGIAAIDPTNPCNLGGYSIAVAQCPGMGINLPFLSRNVADRPTILGTVSDSITLASRNEVASFNILNSGGSGIAGQNVVSFNIHDLSILNSKKPGILITNAAGTGSIRGVTANNNTGGGIIINNTGAQSLTVDLLCNTTIGNVASMIASDTIGLGNGLDVRSGSGPLTVNAFMNTSSGNMAANGTVQNPGQANSGNGLYVASTGGAITIKATENTFTNNVGVAVLETGDGALINAAGPIAGTFTSNVFTGNTNGLRILAGNGASTLMLASNTMSSNNLNGLEYVGSNTSTLTLTATNNQFTMNGRNGARLQLTDGSSLTANITGGNNFSGNGLAFTLNEQNGLYVEHLSSGTMVINITGVNHFQNNNGDGLFYDTRRLLASGSTGTVNITGPNVFGTNLGNGIEIIGSSNAVINLNATNGVQINTNAHDGILIRGAVNSTINLVATGDTINTNAFNGIEAIVAGSTLATFTATVNNNFVRQNGVDGITMDVETQSMGNMTVSGNQVTGNRQDGIFLGNGGTPVPGVDSSTLTAVVTGNFVDSNGRDGVSMVANGATNRFTVSNNLQISNNGRHGIVVEHGASADTQITIDNNRSIFGNKGIGIFVESFGVGGLITGHITRNVVNGGDHEAIVLHVDGGDPVAGVFQTMNMAVNSNILTGTAPITGATSVANASLTSSADLSAPESTNGRFIAFVGDGPRAHMCLQLIGNQNDLNYNLVYHPPFPTTPGGTNGNLFDFESTIITNTGLANGNGVLAFQPLGGFGITNQTIHLRPLGFCGLGNGP